MSASVSASDACRGACACACASCYCMHSMGGGTEAGDEEEEEGEDPANVAPCVRHAGEQGYRNISTAWLTVWLALLASGWLGRHATLTATLRNSDPATASTPAPRVPDRGITPAHALLPIPAPYENVVLARDCPPSVWDPATWNLRHVGSFLQQLTELRRRQHE